MVSRPEHKARSPPDSVDVSLLRAADLRTWCQDQHHRAVGAPAVPSVHEAVDKRSRNVILLQLINSFGRIPTPVCVAAPEMGYL